MNMLQRFRVCRKSLKSHERFLLRSRTIAGSWQRQIYYFYFLLRGSILYLTNSPEMHVLMFLENYMCRMIEIVLGQFLIPDLSVFA